MYNQIKRVLFNILGTVIIVAATIGGIYVMETNKLPNLQSFIAGTEQYANTLAKNITQKKTPTPSPTVTPEYTIILPSETPTPTPYVIPPATPTVTPDPYTYRQYTSSLISYLPDLKIPFPKVITSIQDKDVTKLACDPFFQSGFYGPYNDAFYLDEYQKDKTYYFQPSERYHLMKIALTATGEKVIHTVTFCKTVDQMNIVMYGVDGSGTNNVIHIATIKDDVMTPVVTIHNSTDDAYFSCIHPLLLTKEKVFYISCSKASGNVREASSYFVYSIDLKNIESKLEYECHEDHGKYVCNP